MKHWLLTAAMLLCSITVSAYSFQVDGIFYTITGSSDLTVSVTYETYDYNSYSGDVVIPSTVTYNDEVYMVTSIGYYAFKGCSSLTSITLPEGVTSIGDYAFSGCSSLTSITLPEGVTSIGYYAFSGCSSLTSITIPEGVTSIEKGAFSSCGSLASITIPENVTSIGFDAFSGCSGLTDIYISSIESWLKIAYGNAFSHPNCYAENLYLNGELVTEIEVPAAVTSIPDYAFYNFKQLTSITIPENSKLMSIGVYAFRNCSSLTSITLPKSVTSIGNYAFENCSSLTSITLPESVTSIGYNAFKETSMEVVMKAITPPTLASADMATAVVFLVPSTAYDAYISASVWSEVASQITVADDEMRKKSVALTAEDDKSALHMAIGDENLKYVTHLTISGTINSYDFMVMRNKMPLLRHLDMENATIVYNAYEHYTGYHTEDNVFPGYGLHNCNLLTLTLPKNITSIGFYAVYCNENLSEIVIPESVTSIGGNAFENCSSLISITILEGVTSIGYRAFRSCSSLKSVVLPPTVEAIGSYAFYNCSSLKSVVLPPTVETIGTEAFGYCRSLTEIRIPSSIRSVGDYAFSSCSSLNDIYVYTVEPISIGQNTFTKDGNNFIGTLHAPKVSYWDYYYDTQWSQFASFAEFDEPYDNFYVEGDKVLDNTTGNIKGEENNNPDAEMGENSGIIVEDDVNQDLGDVDIEHDGEHGGSIIVDGTGCVNADKLHFHIKVKGGRWYFFCFPFDVRSEDIKMEGGAEWIFRYYDGAERANNGKGGWKNVTSDGDGNHLKAATGYIFQCSKDDVLILTAKNKKIKKEDKYNELVEHVTENAHDASWNFVGNPYLSYYEVSSEDYSAPITVWDGSKYIAIRPGDDDYQLAPFEAFFVQKPEGADKVNYNADRQMTHHQSQEAAAKARARHAKAVNPDRLLVNITLADGQNTDLTRVVFNNSAAMGYETACDAAKFSTNGVPQLYTIDSRAVKYAINERPVAEGIVTVGYSVPSQGNYTLAAPRMDTPIYVKDNYTGTVHDFAEGDYEFASEAGTFEDRFTVIMKAGETSIEQLTIGDAAPVFNIKGQRVEDATEQGIYIKDNRKVVNL